MTPRPPRRPPRRAAASALGLLAALLALVAGGWGPAGAASSDGGSDPLRRQQWNLGFTGVDATRSFGTGSGATVAVVGTGVDSDHPDLQNRLLPGRNFVEDGAPPEDDNGQGTHMTGIVAAVTGNGVGVASMAPGARILPVKALDSFRTSDPVRFLTALRWAARPRLQGVDVRVLVFSLPVNWPASNDSDLQTAIDDIASWGVTVVGAVGPVDHYGDAHLLRVVAVDRNGRITADAGRGLRRTGIAAPGGRAGSDEGIVSTWPTGGLFTGNGYRTTNGIEQAAAHVAGAAAVLRGRGVGPQATTHALLAGARDAGTPPGVDDDYGYGFLDMPGAVAIADADRAVPTTRPVTTSPPTSARRSGGPAAPRPGAPTARPGERRAPDAAAPSAGGRARPGPPVSLPSADAALTLIDERGGPGGGTDRPLGLLAAALASLCAASAGLSATLRRVAGSAGAGDPS